MNAFMNDEIKQILKKIIDLESEMTNLKEGYFNVNKSYVKSLTSLKTLTHYAADAAKRSAKSAALAAKAATNAAHAAQEAAALSIISTAQ
jgi:hypothetical protein